MKCKSVNKGLLQASWLPPAGCRRGFPVACLKSGLLHGLAISTGQGGHLSRTTCLGDHSEVICLLMPAGSKASAQCWAWKRRWFVLRSGRLTGDPDVLEYYKNDHAKKPIRIIDLNLCQQVDAGLTFNKKEFENSYIFDINTIDRIFYLVADSEEEMNKWVRCICDICGFNPTEEDPSKPLGSSSQAPSDLPFAVNTAPPSTQVDPSSAALPPSYQLISLPPHPESLGLQEDPQDYLLLINCQSKKPEPTRTHADSAKSTSSETDCNDASSQDCYDIPRTFPSDRSSSLEGFHNHFKIKSVLTVGSVSSEELDENYVPMNPNSPPQQQSSSFTEPIQEANYVPMTPGTFDFSSFGMQVPPPAHMGFRSSPKTPPRRPVPVADCEPPPVDRNLKPDRKGQSPKILRPKPHGLERTDSQTIGDFATRRKAKPAPLEIKPLPEWEELQAPVRSPITRSFARDSSRFPLSPRPDSVHSTTSSSDSHDSEENYVPMNPSLSGEDPNLFGSNSLDGGSSPMVKPKGDKQVEYLDLDLDSGKSTPPRKQKSSGSGSSVADERVDYVVVDQQKTLALKSTREAWTDGRQSTESDTPTKSVK
ncbi:GRB2-associated-binding protein 1 isoform X7 [Castor canadensis]|uniref:GRB2-associated-binding protein 1 isoform X7 n=1 Tax=Castor canadensis TaxID=51338 RepID=A0AC58JXB3_CASCN